MKDAAALLCRLVLGLFVVLAILATLGAEEYSASSERAGAAEIAPLEREAAQLRSERLRRDEAAAQQR